MKKVLITDAVHPSIIKSIKKLGFQVDYHPQLPYPELPSIIEGYHGIIINSKIIMNKEMMDLARNLKFIGRLGSGLDIIDLDYAKEKQIAVLSAPEGNRNAVAEHAMGMLLSQANNLIRSDREVRSLKWYREKNRGFELQGKKIGIIGFGHTGSFFAKKLAGFDVQILAHDKYKKHFTDDLRYVKEVELDELLNQCDIISLHLPLTPETEYYLDEAFVSKCLQKPILINTSRGKIVNTKVLIRSLEEGRFSGACLDVFENEKPESYTDEERMLYMRLFKMENVILSPHVAGWTKESKKKIAYTLIEKIRKMDLGK